MGFDFIEIAEPDFRSFGDGFAHVSCLSRWHRRDEFIAAWNRALSEYFSGKALLVGADGRVTYTDPGQWRIDQSPAVRQRQAEQWQAYQAEIARKRADLDARIESTRRKAVALGLASPADANRVIREMTLEEFQRYFEEFAVSKAFFHEIKAPKAREAAGLPPLSSDDPARHAPPDPNL